MQHARSRKGCLTCRSKKVKCDEQTPKCRRCHRLELQCEWTKPGARQRPSLKSRCKDNSALPRLLPKAVFKAFDFKHAIFEMPDMGLSPSRISSSSFSQSTQGHDVRSGEAADVFPSSAFAVPDFIPAWEDWYSEIPFTNDGGVATEVESSSSATADDTPFCHDRELPLLMQTDWTLQAPTLASIHSIGTSWQNMVLSPAFLQTGKEGDALQYFTTLYPTMTVSKAAHWSSYILMLRHNSQQPMVMHLLIAASLMDLALSQNYNEDMCSAAQAHAQAGMLLLKEAMNSNGDADPVGVITASLFLYRYTAAAKELSSRHMIYWSEELLNYVKENRLVGLCTSSESSETTSIVKSTTTLAAVTQQKKAHLARLLLWTFYEDVFAGVGGYGGSLARYFSEDPERAREIFQHSSAELESAWGPEYPERELLDDVENAPIIAFLYEVIALYAEVHRIMYALPHSAADKAVVEDKIEKLENRSRSLIRLTTIKVQPRSRVMVNADYMVPIFYALRIYCFRCFLKEDDLAVDTPPVIQSCVNSILQLAQRSLSHGPLDPMKARFQWALFMAGIETTDKIYKEWVLSKLKTAKMSLAFQTIICMQEETGIRASMSLIRPLLGATY